MPCQSCLTIYENDYVYLVKMIWINGTELFQMYAYSAGYHFGSRSISKCNNFLKPVQNNWVNGVCFIQTKICVILYWREDCVCRSVKIAAPGTTYLTHVWEYTVTLRTLSLLYTNCPNWKCKTKYYHTCKNDNGGFSLNVDILSNDPILKPWPAIVDNYRDVCSCRTVP